MGTVYANPLARSTILGKEFRGFSLLSTKLPAKICLHFDLRLSALGSNSLAGNFRHYWSNLCTHVQHVDSESVNLGAGIMIGQ